MTYPPQLPTVLLSALSSVEGSPGRRHRRTAGAQTSHTGRRLQNPETTTQLRRGRPYPPRPRPINVAGVIALAVVIALALVVALGVRLGNAEEGRPGSLGRQPGSAAGSGVATRTGQQTPRAQLSLIKVRGGRDRQPV